MNDEALRRLIADHFHVPVARVTDDADFCRDLGADSLDLVSLTMLVEEKFDIEISDVEAEPCVGVSQALELLRSKGALR